MRVDGFCVMKDEAEKNEWILDQLVIVKTKKLYGDRGNGAGRKRNSLKNHIMLSRVFGAAKSIEILFRRWATV